jgi:hypothetical protein
MLFRYFLNDFETVPVAPIITGITFVFIFHMCCISTEGLSYYYYYLFIYSCEELITHIQIMYMSYLSAL